MGEWPYWLGGTRVTAAGAVTSGNTRPTLITSSGTANTKGSWTELIAATAHAAAGVLIHARDNAAAGASSLVDIGIGAAGSEQVLIPDLFISRGGNHISRCVYLPLAIPEGVRLSARMASSTPSSTNHIGLSLIGSSGVRFGSTGLATVTAYGVNAADSGGTDVDPGGTANTKGSWVQMTASTTYPIRWLMVSAGIAADSSRAEVANHTFDIGIGGAGSEQVLVPDLHMGTDPGSDAFMPGWWAFPVAIPASTRIAIRQQCSITTAGDRVADFAVYGVT